MLNLRIFTMSLLLIVTALMEVEQLEKKIRNLVTLICHVFFQTLCAHIILCRGDYNAIKWSFLLLYFYHYKVPLSY